MALGGANLNWGFFDQCPMTPEVVRMEQPVEAAEIVVCPQFPAVERIRRFDAELMQELQWQVLIQDLKWLGD
jgi:hypothetical protein